MRVTIIPADQLVVIDGTSVIIDNMPIVNASIHAVQWYETNGTIEHKDTSNTNNVVLTHIEEITELSSFQEIIDIATAKIAADKIIAAERETITSEMIIARVRADRDFRLTQSDWTQLSDVTLSPIQLAQWKEYRQQLRDITLQTDFPTNIVWPEKPQ
jgi:hypothetical protein